MLLPHPCCPRDRRRLPNLGPDEVLAMQAIHIFEVLGNHMEVTLAVGVRYLGRQFVLDDGGEHDVSVPVLNLNSVDAKISVANSRVVE
jgi:hypothetical protein